MLGEEDVVYYKVLLKLWESEEMYKEPLSREPIFSPEMNREQQCSSLSRASDAGGI
jgi:hypothetical protein